MEAHHIHITASNQRRYTLRSLIKSTLIPSGLYELHSFANNNVQKSHGQNHKRQAQSLGPACKNRRQDGR